MFYIFYKMKETKEKSWKFRKYSEKKVCEKFDLFNITYQKISLIIENDWLNVSTDGIILF